MTVKLFEVIDFHAAVALAKVAGVTIDKLFEMITK